MGWLLTATFAVMSCMYACAPPSHHAVALQWKASVPNSSNPLTYSVYRSNLAAGPFQVLVTGVGQTSYTDTSVKPGRTYSYQVTAVDKVTGMESPASNTFTVNVP